LITKVNQFTIRNPSKRIVGKKWKMAPGARSRRKKDGGRPKRKGVKKRQGVGWNHLPYKGSPECGDSLGHLKLALVVP